MLRNLRFDLSGLTLAIIFTAMAAITAVQGFLTYRRVYNRIQEGFDRKLLAISTVAAAFIDGGDHQRIMEQKDENSPLYLQYVEPMRRIIKQKDVTYLYTQIPTGGDNIVYGVDGTVGKDHSAIGAADVAPAGEIGGILSVYQQGASYLSGLHVWQEWGLLKSAYAPIRARDGAITAMAGTDVNISIIKRKTLIALFIVTGCGLLFLSLAGAVSARVVRRVTEPISRLKGAALQVAAGRYGLQAAIDSPTELALLAGSFNRLSRSLERQLLEIRQINESVESQRRERLLFQALQRRDLTASPPAAAGVRLLQLPAAASCRDASGWVRWQNQILLWAGPVESNPLAAARTRHDLALVLQPLLHRCGADWGALARRLETLFSGRVDGYLLVNLEDDCCLFQPRRCPAPGLSGQPVALEAGRRQQLPPNTLLTWCSRAELGARLPAIHGALDVATGPQDLLDLMEARLTGDPGATTHALVFLWRTGCQGHPIETLRAVLRKNDLVGTHFAGLTAAELDLLLSVAQIETRSPDDRLTLQGEHTEMLYLVLAGRVRVDTGEGPVVLSAVQWIGEFSVLYGGAANATVTALTPLDCLVWDRAPLTALLRENPGLERSFRAVLARAMTTKLGPTST
jgi:HAMP domain-containing protein